MKYGDGLDVMFGGGRQNFLPETTADPEYADQKGKRKDGRGKGRVRNALTVVANASP